MQSVDRPTQLVGMLLVGIPVYTRPSCGKAEGGLEQLESFLLSHGALGLMLYAHSR